MKVYKKPMRWDAILKRITKDKKTVQYIDFYDSGSKHLETHSKARIRHLKQLGQKDVKLV